LIDRVAPHFPTPAISTTSRPTNDTPQTAQATTSGLRSENPACFLRKSQREAPNNATAPNRANSACFFRWYALSSYCT